MSKLKEDFMNFTSALNALDAAYDAISNTPSVTRNTPQSGSILNTDSAEELISELKVAAINIRTLHRHLSGGDWFTVHELLGNWYDDIDDFEDQFVENLMAFGVQDQPVDCEKLIEIRDYSEEESLKIVKDTFDKLKSLSVTARNDLNISTALAPIFDGLEQFVEIESEYKLSRYFKM